MQIGTVAKNAGVGVETIRFYERKGLIERPAKPVNGGFRSYPEEVVERIRFVRQAQDLGFSLAEISELLSLRADPSTNCSTVRDRAESKLHDVKEKVARLLAIQSALTDLIEACPGKGPAARRCSILEALETDGERKSSDQT